ncbi:DUF6339 family protein [Streptomyces sp. NPDC059999]|uniref:DUF6339 family protein n=1 Tax=Streptomyces sp. NPDC059999 TaxID=3347030 RepID=UPI003695675B
MSRVTGDAGTGVMSLLYPRLLPGETERRFRMLHEVPAGGHASMADNHSSRAVYAATGGRRVTRDELDQLRGSVLRVAHDQGFPAAPSPAQRTAFDREAAQVLREGCRMVPGEAAQRQVWAFLALVLLPDVCVWRWPADAGNRYVADRFKGTDLTRHALARLWTRAHVLRDDAADDPYHLLDVLGEADLDQIMARRSALAGSPALVRAIVRTHRDDEAGGASPASRAVASRAVASPAVAPRAVASRAVLRESLTRLLRLTAFVDLDSASEPELGRLVRQVRSEARAALGG